MVNHQHFSENDGALDLPTASPLPATWQTTPIHFERVARFENGTVLRAC
jgi:hypothetical protein